MNSEFGIPTSNERNVLIRGGGEEIEIPVDIFAKTKDVSGRELLKWDKILSEKLSQEIFIYGKVDFSSSYYCKDADKTDVSKFTRGFFIIYIDRIDGVKVNYYR